MKFLFLGGSADGQELDVDSYYSVHLIPESVDVIPSSTDWSLKPQRYDRRRFAMSAGDTSYTVSVYVLSGMPEEEATSRLWISLLMKSGLAFEKKEWFT